MKLARRTACVLTVLSLISEVTQARVLLSTCGQHCAPGGRAVCDKAGKHVAPNMCLAQSCQRVTNLSDLSYCPEDEPVRTTPSQPVDSVNVQGSDSTQAQQQRVGKPRVSMLISSEACEKTCEAALIGSPICDKDGVFVADSLCKARFCMGYTSIDDVFFCPDGGLPPKVDETATTTQSPETVQEAVAGEESKGNMTELPVEEDQLTELGTSRAAAVARVEAIVDAANKEEASSAEDAEAMYEDTIVQVVEDFKHALQSASPNETIPNQEEDEQEERANAISNADVQIMEGRISGDSLVAMVNEAAKEFEAALAPATPEGATVEHESDEVEGAESPQ